MFELFVAAILMNAQPTGLDHGMTTISAEVTMQRTNAEMLTNASWPHHVTPAPDSFDAQRAGISAAITAAAQDSTPADAQPFTGQHQGESAAPQHGVSFAAEVAADRVSHEAFLSQRWRWFEVHETTRLGTTALPPLYWTQMEP